MPYIFCKWEVSAYLVFFTTEGQHFANQTFTAFNIASQYCNEIRLSLGHFLFFFSFPKSLSTANTQLTQYTKMHTQINTLHYGIKMMFIAATSFHFVQRTRRKSSFKRQSNISSSILLRTTRGCFDVHHGNNVQQEVRRPQPRGRLRRPSPQGG